MWYVINEYIERDVKLGSDGRMSYGLEWHEPINNQTLLVVFWKDARKYEIKILFCVGWPSFINIKG